MAREYLGELEQVVLLALMRLGEDAYGVTIRREIEGRTGRRITLGSVYPTLHRLEAKGFVRSHAGDPTPTRGGRSKRLFRIQPEGRAAIARTKGMLTALWDGLEPDPGETT